MNGSRVEGSLASSVASGQAVPAWVPPVLLGVLSVCYYAIYFDAGYNFADEGNYAQFVYELFLGRSFSDLPLSYGVLWFTLGEALFRVFGPDLLMLRVLLFGGALITALLAYDVVVTVTGRKGLGLAIAAIPAFVPPFLPTVFYGLCILMNGAAQARLSDKLADLRDRDVALAGLALGLSFQLRADFGYIFAASLAILLMLAAMRAETRQDRLHRILRYVAVSVVACAIAHIPGFLLATNDGYGVTLFGQYIAYPAMLLDYGLKGLSALFGHAVSGNESASVLLQRPGLNIFAAPSLSAALLALLIYLPPLVVAAFAAQSFLLNRGAPDRLRHGAIILVVLVMGVAAMPHYFFYRPDLSHVANFMPGYAVLVGVFAWQTAVRARRGLSYAVLGVLTLNIVSYLWVGLTTEGTGSIAGSWARTDRFHAENGVDVRVNAGEKALLDDLKAIIDANSEPGDKIVCVPYCPGIAFMTGRRLLFREQYVDDTLPLREPDWIPRAITQTREKRPPVIVIMNWAINGTENSRFSRWAAPYMEALQTLAREKIGRPGLEIYLL